MNANYKPGDRVITKINGVEVEASVVRVWVDVDVKTADGKRFLRALSRVRPVDGEPAASAEANSEPAKVEPSAPADTPAPMDTPLPAEPVEVPAPVDAPIAPEAVVETPDQPQVETPSEEPAEAVAEAGEMQCEEAPLPTANNAPETPVKGKGKKRRKGWWKAE